MSFDQVFSQNYRFICTFDCKNAKDEEVPKEESKNSHKANVLKRNLFQHLSYNNGLPVTESLFIKLKFRIILKITALIARMVGTYIAAKKHITESYRPKGQELLLWE